MKAIHYLIILSTSVFIFNSCTKDVAGPAGPTGPPGSQGASASYYVTIDSVLAINASTAWVQNTGSLNSYYEFNINPVQGLTNPNNSIVEVYYSQTYNNNSTWFEMPVASSLQSGDAFYFYYDISTVVIEYASTSGSAPAQNLYFKIVVITPP